LIHEAIHSVTTPSHPSRWFFFVCTFPEEFVSHPIVTDFVTLLDENRREAFEERAAVMQFEAGIERDLAEALALLLVIRQYPKEVLAGLA
jgi:hypothetical protein